MTERLCAEDITRLAHTASLRVQVHDCLPSTNRTAKELAACGAPEGTVVIASSQTQGRGRLGRSFYSPADTGLYMSVVLRPTLAPEKALMITVAAAVAVARAVETLSGRTAYIKWVNDVYCDERKVCGILTEASMDRGTLSYAVLGIGINVCPPKNGFLQELQGIAGAVFDEEHAVDRNTVAAAVLDAFFEQYAHIEDGAFVEEYRARSMLCSRAVTVCTPLGERQAVALRVDEQCRLVVRYEDGQEDALSSGDVRIRLQ